MDHPRASSPVQWIAIGLLFACSDPRAAERDAATAPAQSPSPTPDRGSTGTEGGAGSGPGVAGRTAAADPGDSDGGGIPSQPPIEDDAPDSTSDPAAPTGEPVLVGWAGQPGDGVPSTTGGSGGPVVTATSATELLEYAMREGPLTIQVQGTFSVPRLQVTSDKTLVGMDARATLEGGVRIRGKADEFVSNVIVRNLRIHGAASDVDGDAVQIHYAHHVWIDHCELWDAPDGELDIVHASNWITVSFTKFWYSDSAPDPEHRFANLVGHTDDNDEDEGRLKVTFHHNWWGPGVIERMPRVRHGEVHVFNNYYSARGNNYAVGAGFQARLLIEGNHFDGVADPHRFYDDEPTAQIVAHDNLYTETSGTQDSGQGGAFAPPYAYRLDETTTVRDLVMREAGPR
jgi:pectate lyase